MNTEQIRKEQLQEAADFYAKAVTDDHNEQSDVADHFIAGFNAALRYSPGEQGGPRCNDLIEAGKALIPFCHEAGMKGESAWEEAWLHFKSILESSPSPAAMEQDKEILKLQGIIENNGKEMERLSEYIQELKSGMVEWGEVKQPSFKIEFTDCWEYEKGIPESDRWMAENREHKIIVVGSTKDEAFEEVIKSIRVMCAFESNYKLPLPTASASYAEQAIDAEGKEPGK